MTGRIAGVILAGGRSSRMGGGDKALRPVGGMPMLARIIERLRPQVDFMVLNANGDPERYSGFGLPVIADTLGDHPGPLAGVLAGLEWASDRPGCTHAVTVACDSPFFPPDLVARLLHENEGSESRIVLAGSGGHRHPVFGLWPVSLSQALGRFLAETETYKVMAFVGAKDWRIAEFPMIEATGTAIDPFFNANTPDDIALAERLATEMDG